MGRVRRGSTTGDYVVIWKDVVKSKSNGMWNAAVKDAERQQSVGATKVKGKAAAARNNKDDNDFDIADSSTTRLSTTADDSAEASSAAGSSTVIEEDLKDLRTCSATLGQILRLDLKRYTVQQIQEILEENQIAVRYNATRLIRNLLEEKQEVITDHITQISIMAYKMTLEVSCE